LSTFSNNFHRTNSEELSPDVLQVMTFHQSMLHCKRKFASFAYWLVVSRYLTIRIVWSGSDQVGVYSCLLLGVLLGILTSKVRQTDLVCDKSSSVCLCMQDYKSRCAAVTICAIPVNIQTHTQTDSIW